MFKRTTGIFCLLMLAAMWLPAVMARTPDGKFVVVVDAGHGGHDIGAPGAVTNEKTINLAVASLLGSMLEQDKDVKVVYTRPDDKFVTLQGRADIANKASGDLFVSIHTNSVDTNAKNRTSVHGAAVYVLGLDRTADNLAVAMRENSVMKLEKDYTTTYQGFDPGSAESYIIFEMSQNKYMRQSLDAAKSVVDQLASTAGRKNNGVKQANFWVLLKTAMPSMLVELDFICNPAEEKFMASKAGQQKLAKAIYNGVTEYRKSLNGGASTRSGQSRQSSTRAKSSHEAQMEQKATTPDKESSTVSYKIQFLVSPKRLRSGCSDFKGLSPVESYSDGGAYKYTFGDYPSARAAASDLKSVRELFPDAFVIKTVGGKRLP